MEDGGVGFWKDGAHLCVGYSKCRNIKKIREREI